MSNIALTVVLPVRNEAQSLVECIAGIRTAGLPSNTQIVVVDDGSTDGSGDLARAQKVEVIVQAGAGYGAALLAGFAAAKGDTIAFLDADATYPPQTLKALWEHPAKSTGMVVANRFSNQNEMPLIRKFGNRVLSRLASLRLRRPIPDLCSGQRMFSRGLLKEIQDLPAGLHFSPALTIRVARLGLPLEYIKTAYQERAGQSKLSLWVDGFLFLRETLFKK